MTTPSPTPGPTGISAKWKYIGLAILTIAAQAFGFIEKQPLLNATDAIATIVYVLPTAIGELEGA